MDEEDQGNQGDVSHASSTASRRPYTPDAYTDVSAGSVDANASQDLDYRMEDETEATLSDLNIDYLDVVSNPESFATAVGAQEKAVQALELTDIERQVAAHNFQHAQKLISRSAAESVPLEPGSIATLKVLTQVRLSTEPARLPVRIWEVKPGPKYTLLSEHGQLREVHAHFSLNPIAGATGRSMGQPIPFHPVYNRPTITLAAAVAAYNKRGSVTAAQRAGRKASAPKRLPSLSRSRPPASPEVEVLASRAAKNRDLPPPLLTRTRSRALRAQGSEGDPGNRRGGRGKA